MKSASSGADEYDILAWITIIALIVVSSGFATVVGWDNTVDWLIAQHVLVDDAAVGLPAMNGAGLDLARLVVCSALAVIVVSLVIIAMRFHRRHRRAV